MKRQSYKNLKIGKITMFTKQWKIKIKNVFQFVGLKQTDKGSKLNAPLVARGFEEDSLNAFKK